MELWRAAPGDVIRLPASCWPQVVEIADTEATSLGADWVRLHWETDDACGSVVLPDMLDAALLHTEQPGKRLFLAAGAGWLNEPAAAGEEN